MDVVEDVDIDLPHPRSYGDQQLAEYRRHLLSALGVSPGEHASVGAGAE
jgi:hypothetical protein